jgi:hypothetical protein
MGLDIWFKDDIRNVLLGVDLASAHLAEHHRDADTRAYREGFQAALAAAAISFGLRPDDVNVYSGRTMPSVPTRFARETLP